VARATGSQVFGQVVKVQIVGDQLVHGGIVHSVHNGHQVVDAPAGDGHADPQLRLDLVALGHGDVAHVVAEPGQPQ
jgi:hypothetical protein